MVQSVSTRATFAGVVPPRSRAEDRLRPVRIWLYGIAAMIFVMVLVGGATRLTDSGLSITEWKPITGIVPPLSAGDWSEAFEKYKQIPEYEQINKGMSLAEFKVIYWWEWGHRFLGRIIGFAFLLPLIYFALAGRLGRDHIPRLALLFVLGGLQGAIGWWMVASGLVERVDVSQYRLAVHLTFAIVLFAAIIWVARTMRPDRSASLTDIGRRSATCLILLVFVQIFLGGLVAGIDAGLTYTTWPLMDGALIPAAEKLLVASPWYVNFGENPLTVQFVHRVMAYVLFLFAWWHVLRLRSRRAPDPVVADSILVALAISAQAGLGIATLLAQVPFSLALLHQGGALVVIGLLAVHRERLSTTRPASRPAI